MKYSEVRKQAASETLVLKFESKPAHTDYNRQALQSESEPKATSRKSELHKTLLSSQVPLRDLKYPGIWLEADLASSCYIG